MVKRVTTILGLAAGAAAGLGALNTWLSWQAGPLENPLPGSGHFYHWVRDNEVYNIFYKVQGGGRPVVLVHGIHAAASSAEMLHPFSGLARDHRVYALDLLGFGLSDRPGRTYTAIDYVDLLDDFLRDVVQQPAAIIGSGLGAAYAITVAARAPERVDRLILICPTGLEHLADPPSTWQRLAGRVLRTPILGSALFNALVSRRALRYFLTERVYADPARVTEAMIDAYYCTSHQAGARYAPAAFIGGALNQSVRETYPTLSQPVQIVWGRAAKITPVSDANQFIRLRPQSHLRVFDRAGLLPHDECPDEFLALAREALGAARSEPAADA
ncbi:MAG: alpha/beta fold hydrolase [Chloroflexi bacterium]|nr:alpha/beta fold hydrolase [Chloroflexota bacterium]